MSQPAEFNQILPSLLHMPTPAFTQQAYTTIISQNMPGSQSQQSAHILLCSSRVGCNDNHFTRPHVGVLTLICSHAKRSRVEMSRSFYSVIFRITPRRAAHRRNTASQCDCSCVQDHTTAQLRSRTKATEFSLVLVP